MIKAIIIEDEINAANLLEGMLKDIDETIVVLEKCGDLPSGIKSIKRNSPDIVFLDIELPVYSGIQLLDFLNPEELTFEIIFTTASDEYAVKAFEMSAVDYLMKPIREEKLRAAIEKAGLQSAAANAEIFPVLKENFKFDSNKKIVVPVSNGHEVLDIKDIYYFKADGAYTNIYFASNKSESIEQLCRRRDIESCIHEKGYRGRPLTKRQQQRNRKKSKTRARVEHIFGFMTNSMNEMYLRYRNFIRNQAAIGLMNLTYNLFRLVQLKVELRN